MQLAYLIYPDECVYARARGRALLGNVSSYENTASCNSVSYFFYEGSLPARLRHNFRRILRMGWKHDDCGRKFSFQRLIGAY